MKKDDVLSEIRRVAALHGGRAPGKSTFERETGIHHADWFGVYWARWSDAVAEAGLRPNTLQSRTPDDVALEKYALLARELGHLPVKGELRLARRRDTTFPSENVFAKYGGKRQLAERLQQYCDSRPTFSDVADIAARALAPAQEVEQSDRSSKADPVQGYVYLLRFGKHFKIGKSNAAGRRERELAILLPDKSKMVHVIKTDDPSGIEAYWHARFAAKRGNGEWFELDANDLRAFKRRRYQ